MARTDATGRFTANGVTELALGPLTFEETLELVEQAAREQDPDHGRDLRPLAERAGGHPLFALEMVSASLESDDDALPDTVESLVTTRIDRLVPADRLLLREASVGGAVVDMSVLADAIDAPDVAATRRWRGLLDFVQPDGHGMLRFRQALYREVAYQGLAYSRRRQVHLLMGEELERRAGDEPDAVAGLLAVHFDEARDQDRAWRYSAFAGDSARSSYANAEAMEVV